MSELRVLFKVSLSVELPHENVFRIVIGVIFNSLSFFAIILELVTGLAIIIVVLLI